MSDLIRREDAIKAVREYANLHTFNSYHQGMLKAVSIIEDIPSADRPQEWIPCSERMPSEKGEYLVSYIPCYWDEIRGDVKVGVDTFRGKSAWAKKKFQRVIAWMPLPEPWKGAGDE